MTTQTLAPGDADRRTWLRAAASRRGVLVPVTLAVAFLVTQGVAQAVTPFIRQDDWTFLLPDHTKDVVPPSYYNISEGRWLNTGWWWLVGQHGTPASAAITYAVGYAVLVAGMWRVLRLAGVRPGLVVDALLGLALYASAIWVQLLYWPGALTPSVIVGATAMWLLPWAARTRRGLALWFVLSGIGAVLTYPPIGVVLLIFAVLHQRDAPWRRVLAVVGAWVASFGVGVLVTYTLNLVVNQHFGLRLAAWRHANPLTSLDALRVNTGRWLETVGALWSEQWWVGLVGLVAIIIGWSDVTVRRRLQRLLVAFVVAIGIDAAQTIGTGVVTEGRGQLWTWLFAVLPVALLLLPASSTDAGTVGGAGTREPLPGGRLADQVATLLLGVLAIGGVLAWRADIGVHQTTRTTFSAIAAQAAQDVASATPEGESPVIVLYQAPTVADSRNGRLTLSTFSMALRVEQGLVPVPCAGQECPRLATLRPGTLVRLAPTGSGRTIVGVAVPTPPGWL
ncbi:hypothetical protein [Intrasporangium sp. YIM S08009]|uniref:hypothetical protein n=1 Tax=Intrasporangium zincisolvens TaxID=3080018 RepID=UPI002B05CAA0|nr:hypothetical protein [Intrasporangium sp. YIM S08009]